MRIVVYSTPSLSRRVRLSISVVKHWLPDNPNRHKRKVDRIVDLFQNSNAPSNISEKIKEHIDKLREKAKT